MTDTPTFDLDTCRMGAYCRTRTTYADGQTTPGSADGRGLCWPCELHGQFAIQQLPRDWHQLVARIPKDASRQGLTPIGRNLAEAPIPMHLDMDTAARAIAWTLDTWAVPVFERIPRAETGRSAEFAERHIRAAWAVARSAGLLDRFYTVLRALPPTEHMPYGDNHTVLAVDDGPGAIATLTQLHHRATAIIGETRRLETRDLPCPTPPHGCGLDSTLRRRVGDTDVFCTNCGWWCTDDQYTQYAITWVPPKLGRCPDCEAPAGDRHGHDCTVARCLATGGQRATCPCHPTTMPDDRVESGEQPDEHPTHDCGTDVWTGIWPGVTEARQYGISLATLHQTGVWDPVTTRWYLPEDGA